MLEQLSREGRLSLPELMARLGIPQTTLGALLAEMERVQLVTGIGERPRRYVVGPAVLFIASRAIRTLDLLDLARQPLHELSNRLGVTTHLAALSDRNDAVIYLIKTTPSHAHLGASYVGATAPIFSTALGKVVAAYAVDSRRAAILSQLEVVPRTEQTVRSAQDFAAMLGSVRATGVAFDREENEPGICCCAAPVFNIRGECVAAISATMTTQQFSEYSPDGIAKEVRAAARLISSSLGFAER